MRFARRWLWLLLLVVLALPLRAERVAVTLGKAEVIADQVRLRDGPGTNHRILDTLSSGQIVSVVGRASGWYEAETSEGGSKGWVNENYLRLSLEGFVAPESRVCALLRLAQSLLGDPYKHGGIGPGGFDCSGFTYCVYREIGSPIPRMADAQYAKGEKVERSRLQPGDLVFFATTVTGAISHAGLYLRDGEFIHASSGHGRVTTSTLNFGYYLRHYVGAARILTDATAGGV